MKGGQTNYMQTRSWIILVFMDYESTVLLTVSCNLWNDFSWAYWPKCLCGARCSKFCQNLLVPLWSVVIKCTMSRTDGVMLCFNIYSVYLFLGEPPKWINEAFCLLSGLYHFSYQNCIIFLIELGYNPVRLMYKIRSLCWYFASQSKK